MMNKINQINKESQLKMLMIYDKDKRLIQEEKFNFERLISG